MIFSNDRQLVRRVKNGCKQSMHTIYLKNKDHLLTLANALLNNRTEAEDVVHDVFVSFAKNVETLNLRKSLKAYLSTCVCNLSRDRLRTQSRHDKKINDYYNEHTTLDPPDILTSAKETNNLIRAALQQLPLEQKEVIVLHIKTGLTFRQIAAYQDVSINTAQGRYRYAIEKLRSILNSEVTK
jgi:RNA polymerase sigma-70 factor (ECF subfamily)